MFKVIVVCSLVVFANAGLLPDPHAYEQHEPANYDFAYSVHDEHTGDVKQQQESRRGDAVQGSYSLVEPDGLKRVVHYSADAHSGFNAVVEREGTLHGQPIAHAAPVAIAHSAPIAVAHAAPALHVSHAPVAVAHAAPALHVSHAPVAIAHAAPALHVSHAPLAVAHHAAPALAVSHAPIAVASHGNAISHHTYSAPIVAHQTYAAPQVVSHQIAAAPTYQQLGYANHGYANQGYANQGYANQGYANQGYANQGYGHNLASQSGYSTVSQVTHHGGYQH